MILNISNNTDIVQFYMPWLINRFKEGFFCIETPKLNNVYQLTPSNFEMIIFQTKNPKPILPYIDLIKEKGFNFLFIITITPYSNEIEQNIDKSEIFDSIKELSRLIGSEHIVWKYAPVILNTEFSKDYHYKYFNILANKLHKYVGNNIVEFIKPFEHPIHAQLYTSFISKDEKIEMTNKFQKIADKYCLNVYSKYNIDGKTVSCLLKKIICEELNISNFKFEILDMGLPNTCKGNCEYCFCGGNKYYKDGINHINSPLFIGQVDKMKKHINRKTKSIYI